jgi:hypothetical protein
MLMSWATLQVVPRTGSESVSFFNGRCGRPSLCLCCEVFATLGPVQSGVHQGLLARAERKPVLPDRSYGWSETESGAAFVRYAHVTMSRD